MEKLKNDNRTDHLVKFDGKGIQQKREQDKNAYSIKVRKKGSDRSKQEMVSSFNDAWILNSISSQDENF
jgi:hypothetical protein